MAIEPPDRTAPPTWAQVLVNAANSRNILRGSPDKYTHDDLCAAWKRSKGKCEVSGLDFDFEIYGNGQAKRPFAPSLDRINPDRPYCRDNVRLVVSIANFAMNAWGDGPLKVLATGVHRLHGEQRHETKQSPKDADLDNMAAIDEEFVDTDRGTLPFPKRRDMHQPTLDFLREKTRTSREIEDHLANEFGVTPAMRSGRLKNGTPAWRNHVAWVLVDLVEHSRGTSQIKRIETIRLKGGGSTGVYAGLMT